MLRPSFLLFAGFLSLLSYFGSDCHAEDWWSPSVSYQKVIDRAKQGSPYYQGLLGIYLRSGEAGCVVNLKLSKQWSQAAARKDHPFGNYNLANLAMLEGDFETATRMYQDVASSCFSVGRRTEIPFPCTVWGRLIFRLFPPMCREHWSFLKKRRIKDIRKLKLRLGLFMLKGLPGLLEKDHKRDHPIVSGSFEILTARFNLGMAYYNGDGVSRSVKGIPMVAYCRAPRTFPKPNTLWAFCFWRGRAE